MHVCVYIYIYMYIYIYVYICIYSYISCLMLNNKETCSNYQINKELVVSL